jgi:hypothetical protein
MKEPRAAIKVQVSPGVFSSEKTVSFSTGFATYQLVLDESQLFNGVSLPVEIIDETADGYLVSLPTDTFTSGSTVHVPRNIVELR